MLALHLIVLWKLFIVIAQEVAKIVNAAADARFTVHFNLWPLSNRKSKLYEPKQFDPRRWPRRWPRLRWIISTLVSLLFHSVVALFGLLCWFCLSSWLFFVLFMDIFWQKFMHIIPKKSQLLLLSFITFAWIVCNLLGKCWVWESLLFLVLYKRT